MKQIEKIERRTIWDEILCTMQKPRLFIKLLVVTMLLFLLYGSIYGGKNPVPTGLMFGLLNGVGLFVISYCFFFPIAYMRLKSLVRRPTIKAKRQEAVWWAATVIVHIGILCYVILVLKGGIELGLVDLAHGLTYLLSGVIIAFVPGVVFWIFGIVFLILHTYRQMPLARTNVQLRKGLALTRYAHMAGRGRGAGYQTRKNVE